MMLRDVLNYDSPVYGRRTSQIHLKAFDFKHASMFLKNFDIEERVMLYSITGGVAKYLLLIEERSLREFIKKKILEKEGFFYQESIFLLSQEFKSPNIYLSILKAIALGNTKLNDISNFVGIEGKKVTRYLDVLQEIGFITRQVPVTEDPVRFRKGVYIIEDNFLNFWFRFVLPNRSRIELRDTKDLLDSIMDSMPDHVSSPFERIGMEFLQGIEKAGKLPANFSHWGKWWDRLNEIDIVALNDDKDILFCECKWKKRKADADAINHLMDTAQKINWLNDSRKEHFAFISKSGFMRDAVELADDNGVLLFELKDMESYFG